MIDFVRAHYLELKLIHLCAAGLWSASALGAFWFVVKSGIERRRSPDDPEIARREAWIRQQFLVAVVLEHAAFLVLLPTGWLLMRALGLGTDVRWFAWKLALVLFVFVPLEVVDVWLSHWHVPRALARSGSDPDRARRAVAVHDVFLWVGGAIVVVTIPVVLYLAVVKPA